MFDWILDGLIDFTPKDRRLNRLLKKGETATARIDGVRVEESGEGGESHYYRLLLADGSALGVRQMLRPQSAISRLGSEVIIRHRKGRAVIDWPATLAQAGTPSANASTMGVPKRTPPERGISGRHLNRKRLERGRRAEAELIGLQATTVMGMPTQNWDLQLEVDGERALAKRAWVPPYALYLLKPGTRLPVAADARGITVDWITAAERDYGLTRGPADRSPPA